MGLGLGYVLGSGLLGTAKAAGDIADKQIEEGAWRERFRLIAAQKMAELDAQVARERQGRQATADTIRRRLEANADEALETRYGKPEAGDTPLTPEQQAAQAEGLRYQQLQRERDRLAFMRDGRNRLEAAVDVGAADSAKLAELDSRGEIAQAKNETALAKQDTATQVALAKIEAAARDSDAGKPPSGYRRTLDGDLEAIPGGPADLKKQGQFNSDTAALNSSFAGFDRLASAANELLSSPGLGGITGLRGKLPNVPGGDAANAQALLDTLKSQVAFGVLQDMRNNSKTGGALGNVSDAEGKRLEANLAALDRSQSLEQFKASLRKVIEYADQAKDRMRESFNMKHGDGGQIEPRGNDVPKVNSRDELANLPTGTIFQAPDGSIRVKR